MEVIMKRFLLPIVAALSILPIFGVNQLKNTNKDNVIVLWDIHGTVVEKDSGKRFKMGIKTGWHMLRSRTARNTYKEFYDKNGFCAGEAVEHQYHELAQEYMHKAEQVLKNGDKKHAKKYRKKAARFAKLAHLFHTFELSYYKMDGIVELLEALKAHGYTQHYVASNIGKKHYEILKKKFPEIFNDTMIQDGLVVDPWEEPILKKPDHMYFRVLQKMFNPNKNNILVFIDDKQENVDAANKCGIIGILTKDVKYLVKQLNAEGLELVYGKRKACKSG